MKWDSPKGPVLQMPPCEATFHLQSLHASGSWLQRPPTMILKLIPPAWICLPNPIHMYQQLVACVPEEFKWHRDLACASPSCSCGCPSASPWCYPTSSVSKSHWLHLKNVSRIWPLTIVPTVQAGPSTLSSMCYTLSTMCYWTSLPFALLSCPCLSPVCS